MSMRLISYLERKLQIVDSQAEKENTLQND
jgi:hypothetical protein